MIKKNMDDLSTLLKAVFLSTFCVALTYLIFTPTYLTNDDAGYALILSGKLVFNQATAYTMFQHIFYTSFIRLMYATYPNIAWYPLTQVLLLYACILIHNFYILKRCKGFSGWLLALLLYLCFYQFLLLKIHFSITSFVLGITAFILLLNLKKDIHPVFYKLLIILLLLLSSMIRWEAWLFLIVWIIVYFACQFFYNLWQKKDLRNSLYSLALIICSLLFCLGFHKIDTYLYERSGNESYRTFNYYRSHLNDYCDLSFFHNDERYALLGISGWTENDYQMMQHWIFMDKDIYSTAKMKAIVDYVPASKLRKRRVINNFRNLFIYLRGNENLRILVLISLVVLMLFDGKRRGFLIFCIAQFLFSITLFYKKFPPESFYTASYLMMPYFLIRPNFMDRRKNLILVLLALFAIFQIHAAYDLSEEIQDQQHQLQTQFKLIEEDSTHIYFYWDGLDIDAIKPFDTKGLSVKNIIFPGTFALHPLNQAKIKAFGIADLMKAISTDDRLLVLFHAYDKKNQDQINIFRKDYAHYMMEHYGLKIESKLRLNKSKISVWDFSLLDEAKP